ncbi:uncharacterized protein J3R85_002223 [Psidium guajava]|nr:uncharacterized protein J3R85_002223 [Psidium guajava]
MPVISGEFLEGTEQVRGEDGDCLVEAIFASLALRPHEAVSGVRQHDLSAGRRSKPKLHGVKVAVLMPFEVDVIWVLRRAFARERIQVVSSRNGEFNRHVRVFLPRWVARLQRRHWREPRNELEAEPHPFQMSIKEQVLEDEEMKQDIE